MRETKLKIFVSSNQKELRKERIAVKEVVLNNRTLRECFDVFLFEDMPAKGKPPKTAYLKEVDNSGSFSNKEYRKEFKVSNQTFVRDLRALSKSGFVISEGRGRALRYKAKV